MINPEMEATCKRLSGAIDLPQVGGCRREAEGSLLVGLKRQQNLKVVWLPK